MTGEELINYYPIWWETWRPIIFQDLKSQYVHILDEPTKEL
jgi:hypothetical protein